VGWEGLRMKDEFCFAYGRDFTGETVRVVKEKEVRQFEGVSDVKAGVGG